MIFVFIWLFVAFDRYIEFDRDVQAQGMVGDRAFRIEQLKISLIWPFCMIVRIATYVWPIVKRVLRLS